MGVVIQPPSVPSFNSPPTAYGLESLLLPHKTVLVKNIIVAIIVLYLEFRLKITFMVYL